VRCGGGWRVVSGGGARDGVMMIPYCVRGGCTKSGGGLKYLEVRVAFWIVPWAEGRTVVD
jgi:hypothetical protein